MATTGFKPSHLPPIGQTGMRGFLLWYKREQPAIYAQIAPKIAAQQPSVFSDYVQSTAQRMRARAGVMSLSARAGRFRGLGQMYSSNDSLDPSQADEQWLATDPNIPDPNVINTFSNPTVDSSVAPPIGPTIDTASAANTGGGTSTPTTSWIGSLIQGATQLFTTQQQLQTASAITNLQLQRAQAGLAPLNIGMNANGIPTFSGMAAGSSTLLLVGGGLLLFMLMGRRGARA